LQHFAKQRQDLHIAQPTTVIGSRIWSASVVTQLIICMISSTMYV